MYEKAQKLHKEMEGCILCKDKPRYFLEFCPDCQKKELGIDSFIGLERDERGRLVKKKSLSL